MLRMDAWPNKATRPGFKKIPKSCYADSGTNLTVYTDSLTDG